jgi:hypothetical protein
MNLVWRAVTLFLTVALFLFIFLSLGHPRTINEPTAPPQAQKDAPVFKLRTSYKDVDVVAFRGGPPLKRLKEPENGALNGSTAAGAAFHDGEGRAVPWHQDFRWWTLHRRVKERGWEMAARAGMKSGGMGSAIAGQVALAKKEVYADVSGHVQGAWSLVETQLLDSAKLANFGSGRPSDGSAGKAIAEKDNADDKASYSSGHWGRNMLAKDGTVKIKLDESSDVVSVRGLKLRDVTASLDVEGGNEDWQIEVQGYHIVDTGNIVMASTSYKYVVDYSGTQTNKEDSLVAT